MRAWGRAGMATYGLRRVRGIELLHYSDNPARPARLLGNVSYQLKLGHAEELACRKLTMGSAI